MSCVPKGFQVSGRILVCDFESIVLLKRSRGKLTHFYDYSTPYSYFIITSCFELTRGSAEGLSVHFLYIIHIYRSRIKLRRYL